MFGVQQVVLHLLTIICQPYLSEQTLSKTSYQRPNNNSDYWEQIASVFFFESDLERVERKADKTVVFIFQIETKWNKVQKVTAGYPIKMAHVIFSVN